MHRRHVRAEALAMAPPRLYPCMKMAYGSEVDARTDAKMLRRRGARKLVPYLCPRCGRFHLTSMGRRERRRKGYR